MSGQLPPKVIWYVTKYVSPPHDHAAGGRGYELMRELTALGYQCVIVTSDANHLAPVPVLDSPTLTEHRDGMQVVWLRTLKAPTAKSWRRIASWLHFEWRLLVFRKRDLPTPDVVIASSLSLLTVLNGLLLRRRYGAPLVFEVRDIWPLTLTEEGGYSPRNPLVRALGMVERLGYRKSDVIVGTMPNLGEHVAHVLGQWRPVHCVPMGYAARTLETREDLPSGYLTKYVPADKFVVGYAGTIGITNALESLFEAAEALRDESRVHFVILGDGPLRADFVRRYGSLPNVTFAPKVSKGAVQEVLAACDLLYLSVYPSRVWDYGQSLNKVIDYMLSGKPIVAQYSGHPSMINEAGCGSFVPPAEVTSLVREIQRYASLAPHEREELGHRGRDWLLENRSYHVLARAYAELVERPSESLHPTST